MIAVRRQSWSSLAHVRDAVRPTCLIVEDAALIGLSLATYFEEQGLQCDVVCSSAEALVWLDAHTPSVAVIDYLLKEGACTSVIAALRRTGVPFIVYSGCPAQMARTDLGPVPWIEKPATREILWRAVAGLIAPSSRTGQV